MVIPFVCPLGMFTLILEWVDSCYNVTAGNVSIYTVNFYSLVKFGIMI